MQKHVFAALALSLTMFSVHAAETAEEKALAYLKAEFSQVDMERVVQTSLKMALDPKTAAKFWPRHQEYMRSQIVLRDKQLALLTKYAEAYKNNAIDDALAKTLLSDGMAYESQRVQNRQRFMARIADVLTPKQRLRYYQLDVLLDTRLRAGVLAQIPLAE